MCDIFSQHTFDEEVKLLDDNPLILITKLAYDKMWHIVNMSGEEIGWLGVVERDGLTFTIRDVFLFRQEVSSVTCEITAEGLSETALEIMKAYPSEPDILNALRFWGHSHVNMGTTASLQDDKQMDVFREQECEYFVRGILNKKGRMEYSLYLYHQGISIEDVPWRLIDPIDSTLLDEISTEIKDKVTLLPKPVYKYPKYKPYKPYIVQDNRAKKGDELLTKKFTTGDTLTAEEERLLDDYLSGTDGQGANDIPPTGNEFLQEEGFDFYNK